MKTQLKLVPVYHNEQLSELLLSQGTTLIGSDDSCSCQISMSGIAPQHCEISFHGSKWMLKTIDPKTWINGGPVRSTALKEKDRLAIGPVEFELFIVPAPEVITTPAVQAAPAIPQVQIVAAPVQQVPVQESPVQAEPVQEVMVPVEEISAPIQELPIQNIVSEQVQIPVAVSESVTSFTMAETDQEEQSEDTNSLTENNEIETQNKDLTEINERLNNTLNIIEGEVAKQKEELDKILTQQQEALQQAEIHQNALQLSEEKMIELARKEQLVKELGSHLQGQVEHIHNNEMSVTEEREAVKTLKADLDQQVQAWNIQREEEKNLIEVQRSSFENEQSTIESQKTALEFQQEELNQLQRQIDEESAQLAKEKEEIEVEKSQLQGQALKIEEERENLENSQLDVNQLEEDRKILDEVREALQAREEEIAQQKLDIEETESTFKMIVLRTEKEAEELKDELREDRQAIVEQKAEFESAFEKWESEKEELIERTEKFEEEKQENFETLTQLAEQKSELEQLQAELETNQVSLQEKMEENEQEVSQLREEVRIEKEKISEEKDGLEATVVKLDEEKQTFEQKKEAFETEKQGLVDEKMLLSEEKEVLEQKSKELEELKSELENVRSEVEASQKTSDEEISALQKEIQLEKEAFLEEKSEFESVLAKLEEEKTVLIQEQEAFETEKQELIGDKKTFEEVKKKSLEESEIQKENNASLESLNEEMALVENEKTELVEQRDELCQKNSELEEAKTDVEEKLRQSEEKQVVLNDKLSELVNYINSLEEEKESNEFPVSNELVSDMEIDSKKVDNSEVDTELSDENMNEENPEAVLSEELLDEESVEPSDEEPSEPLNELRSTLAGMFDLPEGENSELEKSESTTNENEGNALLSGLDSGANEVDDEKSHFEMESEEESHPVVEEIQDENMEIKSDEIESIDAEDPDSMEAYMKNLLSKTSGGKNDGNSVAVKEKKEEVSDNLSFMDKLKDGISSEVEEVVSEETFEEPVKKEPKPRKKVDVNAIRNEIDSLREVANFSARSAVAKHDSVLQKGALTLKVTLAVASFALAALLHFSSFIGNHSFSAQVFACLVVGIMLVGELTRNYLNIKKRTKKVNDSIIHNEILSENSEENLSEEIHPEQCEQTSDIGVKEDSYFIGPTLELSETKLEIEAEADEGSQAVATSEEDSLLDDTLAENVDSELEGTEDATEVHLKLSENSELESEGISEQNSEEIE